MEREANEKGTSQRLFIRLDATESGCRSSSYTNVFKQEILLVLIRIPLTHTGLRKAGTLTIKQQYPRNGR